MTDGLTMCMVERKSGEKRAHGNESEERIAQVGNTLYYYIAIAYMTVSLLSNVRKIRYIFLL